VLLKTYMLSLGFLAALVSITACGEVPTPAAVEPVVEVEAEAPAPAEEAAAEDFVDRSAADACARGCEEQSQIAFDDCVAEDGEAARARCPVQQATVRYECMSSECEREGRRRDGRSEALRICERECGVNARDDYDDCVSSGSAEACTEASLGDYIDCTGGCPE